MDMDKWIKLNSQTAGRDKQARLIQYASRAVWDILERGNHSPRLIDNFKTIEYILSTFRKLLRFGKCVDIFYMCLRTVHNPDLVVRITLTMSKLSQSLFLLGDHIMWLARTGLTKPIDIKKWSQFSNKYWLFSIIMNLCRDFYEIIRLFDLHRAGVKSGIVRRPFVLTNNSLREHARLALRTYVIMLGHRDVLVDTVKNICDFFIPLTALGYTKLTPKAVGILGTISSIAGIIALVDPTAKLLPA